MDDEDDPPFPYEAVVVFECEDWGTHYFLLMRVWGLRQLRRDAEARDFPIFALIRMPYEEGIGNRAVQVVPGEISLADWRSAQLVDHFADRREVAELLRWVT